MRHLEANSVIWIDSHQELLAVFQVIRQYGICGLRMETTGKDPLISRIELVSLALPNGSVYVADTFNPRMKAATDLVNLMEDSLVKKVFHDAKFELAFIRESSGRRLKSKNIFDTMLASQICWSGYYLFVPSKSLQRPWKKKPPDHRLEALAERHLGIRLINNSYQQTDCSTKAHLPEQIEQAAMRSRVLLPLHAILLRVP